MSDQIILVQNGELVQMTDQPYDDRNQPMFFVLDEPRLRRMIAIVHDNCLAAIGHDGVQIRRIQL